MPVSPPPSALPSQPSPSRPADTSSKFVVSDAAAAAAEGSDTTGPVGHSGSVAGESVQSGEASGDHDEIAPEGSSVGREVDEEVSPPITGDAENSPEPTSSVELFAPGHALFNPLPELELVSQDAAQKKVPTSSDRKANPIFNPSSTRVDTSVPQNVELEANRALSGPVVGSSAEGVLNLGLTAPEELDAKATQPSDFLGSREVAGEPRAQDVKAIGRTSEISGGGDGQAESRSMVNQTKVLAGDLPVVDRGVGQVGSNKTHPHRPERPERLEGSGGRISVSTGEVSQRGEVSNSPTRPEGVSMPLSSVESSDPARELSGESVRTVHQGNTAQPTKVNASTQSMSFSGGLAEAVDSGAAKEVPVSVSLARRALRSLGRGHGGATVVQLRPAQFGKVTVRVQLEEGRVQADLVARTPEAARVLGEHLRLLRDSLEHKGLVVDRLEVREESKFESSRLDPHNEKDTGEDRSGGERDHQDGDASSKRPSPKMLGQAGVRADEFGQVLMAAEEQA